MEDTPGDPNIPNELAIAAEAIKRERRQTITMQLEHLAKSAEADINFAWPVGAKPEHHVIPREWDTVSSLRAKADLFREIASYFRVPAEMLPKEDAASAATEIEDRGRELWERARRANCLHSFDDPDGAGMRCVKCGETLAEVMLVEPAPVETNGNDT